MPISRRRHSTMTPTRTKIAHNMPQVQVRAIMGLGSRAGTVERPNSTLYQPGLRSFWQAPIGLPFSSNPWFLFDFFQSRHITGFEIGSSVTQELMLFYSQRFHPIKNSCAIPANGFCRLVYRKIFRFFSHIGFLQSRFYCHCNILKRQLSNMRCLTVDNCRLYVVYCP